MRNPEPGPVADLLAAGAAVHQSMQDALERRVAAQRLAGASWAVIARELGCSRQSAHERWRYVDRLPGGVAVGRDALSGGAFFRDVATGAVIGPEQFDQVAKHGRIIDHHPLNAIEPA